MSEGKSDGMKIRKLNPNELYSHKNGTFIKKIKDKWSVRGGEKGRDREGEGVREKEKEEMLGIDLKKVDRRRR